MDVQLVGEANDYVCKSISGGTVSIMPPPGAGFKAEDSTIAGNTCLYGATMVRSSSMVELANDLP